MNTRPLFFMKLRYFFGAWTALAIFFATQSYLMIRFEERQLPLYKIVGPWFLSFYIWALFCLGVYQVLRRFPIDRPTWKRDLIVHVPLSLLVSVLQIIVFLQLLPWTGLYSPRFAFEVVLQRSLISDIHANVFTYWAFIAVFHGVRYYRKFRDRELMNSQLETQLAQARLQVLKMQLDPHFLFNTMNSVSSLMRSDVEAADTMLVGLSNLLRMSLDNVGKQELPLREEMEFLEGYLEIQQMRFRERLKVKVNIDPEALDAMIPNMITQPLVENAVVHGISPHSRQGKIEVSVKRELDSLVIRIYNDGPSLPVTNNGTASIQAAGSKNGRAGDKREGGVGVSNTRTRLQYLYGELHSFILQDAPGGGVEAVIRIPYRNAGTNVKASRPEVPSYADQSTHSG